RQDEGPAAPEGGRPAFERPEPDLRALQVLQDRDRPADPRLHRPDALDGLAVLDVGPVGEVEPGHVHAGPGHLLDDPLGDRRRPQGADDLGEPLRGHGADPGATTGFASTPRPSISASTTSPTLR